MGLFEELLDFLFPNRYKKIQLKLDENKEEIIQAYQELTEYYNKNEYFTKKSHNEWKNKWSKLSSLIFDYQKKRKKIISPIEKELEFLNSALSEETFLRDRNNQYIQNEITKNRDYFNTLEKFPLTQKQCQAIVVDETRNLLVAGAGTGKTSTLAWGLLSRVMCQLGNEKRTAALMIGPTHKSIHEFVTKLSKCKSEYVKASGHQLENLKVVRILTSEMTSEMRIDGVDYCNYHEEEHQLGISEVLSCPSRDYDWAPDLVVKRLSALCIASTDQT